MKRLAQLALVALIAVPASAAVFERFLSPDRPQDRAILRYVDLERSGRATSNDLAELGVLLLDKGFPKDAERYLKKAIRADRKNYEASFRLGLVRQHMGRERAAMRSYQRTLRHRPGHTQARFMLALAQERAGQRKLAIQNYARAYRHLPELADPQFNPLVISSRLQTEAALVHYRRTERTTAFKAPPMDPRALHFMMLAFPPEPQPSPVPPPQVAPPAPPQVAPQVSPQAATQESSPAATPLPVTKSPWATRPTPAATEPTPPPQGAEVATPQTPPATGAAPPSGTPPPRRSGTPQPSKG